jgi:hypothetical protein
MFGNVYARAHLLEGQVCAGAPHEILHRDVERDRGACNASNLDDLLFPAGQVVLGGWRILD